MSSKNGIIFSSVGKENDFSPRTIIPLLLHSKEVRVFQYDPKEEILLSEEKMDSDVVRNYKLGNLLQWWLWLAGSSFQYDKQTAPYPFDTIGKWMNMTNHITESLFHLFTNPSPITFILDPDSDHRYHYTQTVNITQLIKPNRDSSMYSSLYFLK